MQNKQKSKLKPGAKHYKAFVGPPAQYDIIGASQFRLLCTLGLREHHKLLDLGCGSLRAGRLFISYLDKNCYYGIEPNKWLIKEAMNNQIGDDIIRIKKPSFSFNKNFNTEVFKIKFDFIIAQSIFSHTGPDLLKKGLSNLYNSITNEGIVALTFVETKDKNLEKHDNGWIYPDIYQYYTDTIIKFLDNSKFKYTKIPWYHPRQSWWLLSKTKGRLPNDQETKLLSGAILTEEFKKSYLDILDFNTKLLKVNRENEQLKNSLSWKITSPLRYIGKLLKTFRR
ncbi:hypothetical protein GF362_03430 [Candidatus Dojkabacteria bacterium]|nr:hypothetical protein [Candidatus Dojkabacteria bacterium]